MAKGEEIFSPLEGAVREPTDVGIKEP